MPRQSQARILRPNDSLCPGARWLAGMRLVVRAALQQPRESPALPPCQLSGRPLLEDLPCAQHDDDVRLDRARQAVRHLRGPGQARPECASVSAVRNPAHTHALTCDDGAALERLARLRVHLHLRVGVQRGVGLVHEDDPGALQQGAREGQELLLPRREVRAVLLDVHVQAGGAAASIAAAA